VIARKWGAILIGVRAIQDLSKLLLRMKSR
jgi:hypothetical protein